MLATEDHRDKGGPQREIELLSAILYFSLWSSVGLLLNCINKNCIMIASQNFLAYKPD